MAATKRARKRGRTGEKIVRATWIVKAVELAIQGNSARRIGKVLGKHHSTVARALNEEFERTRPAAEDIERMRAVQNEQLDEQIAMWTALERQEMPELDIRGLDPLDAARVIAAGAEIFNRKAEAARRLNPIQKRKADLNGLDAPTQSVQLTAEMTSDARQQLLDRLSRLAAEGGASEGDCEPDAGGSP